MAEPNQSPPASSRSVKRSVIHFLLVIHHFFFKQRHAFLHVFLRGLFGALSGFVLFLGVIQGVPRTEFLWLAAVAVCGVCVLGGIYSSFFRCSVLLLFPSILGSRGRAFLILLTLSVLHTGPVTNIQQNVQAVAESLSCNLDVQVHNSKLLWKEAVKPFLLITQQLMDEEERFQSMARNVSWKFQAVRDEMVRQYGYDGFETGPAANDTQEQFFTRTMMQCDSVVAKGIQRCSDWFSLKWEKCMDTIAMPIINHLLCVPLKFHFLCQIMRVMSPWCKEHIPVEGNFGQLFDQLNLSVEFLSREFTTELIVKEEKRRPALGETLLDDAFKEAVRKQFEQLSTWMKKMLDILDLLRSFSFITVITNACDYVWQFKRNFWFDNIYITSYFKQIDARRKRAGKSWLLPLRQTEKEKFIDPARLKFHPKELKALVSGGLQVLSVFLLSVVLLIADLSIFHALDIVSRHTVIQLNITSHNELNIDVGGDSMMARLLSKTFAAFNTSSNLSIITDNQRCVSPPSSLPASVYVSCASCLLLGALFCCLQVYGNRLRRVITAFIYPEREKKRILFIYRLQLWRRFYSDNKEFLCDESGPTVS